MCDEQLNLKRDVEIPKKTLKDAVTQGLDEKGAGKDMWLWFMFALCVTPNIINGFHISSYVFFSKDPEAFYCQVPINTNDFHWTDEQYRSFAFPGGVNNTAGCEFIDWNYDHLYSMSYSQALSWNKTKETPGLKSCLDMMEVDQNYWIHYEYKEEATSIVPEWNLVCERKALKSNVQVALSIGKFIGASVFGIVSDKYGRKTAFSVAAVIYILSGLLTTFSSSYIFLLIGRTGLGFCGAGVFYSLFTLITENAGQKLRSSLSIAYNFSYPLGFLFLAYVAHLLPNWRDLSFALTVPSFLLVIHLWFLVESPRYLISKGQYKKAYRMLYGKKPSADFLIDYEAESEPLTSNDDNKGAANDSSSSKSKTFSEKLSGVFNEVIKIYGPASLRRKALICHFTWCVTSLTYYMLALNAKNFKANIYVWTGLTGTVDIFGYIVSIFILKWSTRRLSQFSLFALAGAFLLIVFAVPKDIMYLDYVLLTFAMMSRFCITSVYAIMTLHTAEMFPTEVRNSVLGISSTAAHFGSFFAPYIVDLLGPIAWYIPTTICGGLVIVAGFLTLLQPETKHINLTDHVGDNEDDVVNMEDFKKSPNREEK